MSRKLMDVPAGAVTGSAAGLLAVALLAALALGAGAVVSIADRAPGSAAPALLRPAVGVAGPRIVALGTVQDGGLPQAGCECVRCSAARRDPTLRRHVASLGIWDPAGDHFYLVDATPDLGEQIEAVHRLRGVAAAMAARGLTDRQPVDGVLLTHAHIGHYLGLAFFGFESLDTRALPVYASRRMCAFLAANAPWDQLVRRGNIVPQTLEPGAPLALAGGLVVVPLLVPHRAEYTDTLGFVVRGPHATVLYVPDTDSWNAWPIPLPAVLAREKVDVAILDGTFDSLDELPGRDVRQIGHPLIPTTIDLLAAQVATGRLRVYFTHLNHSNTALETASAARRNLEARGFHVLGEGEQIAL